MVNTVAARMEEEYIVLLRKVCKYRGEDLSDFIRRSVLKELSFPFLSRSGNKKVARGKGIEVLD